MRQEADPWAWSRQMSKRLWSGSTRVVPYDRDDAGSSRGSILFFDVNMENGQGPFVVGKLFSRRIRPYLCS